MMRELSLKDEWIVPNGANQRKRSEWDKDIMANDVTSGFAEARW